MLDLLETATANGKLRGQETPCDRTAASSDGKTAPEALSRFIPEQTCLSCHKYCGSSV